MSDESGVTITNSQAIDIREVPQLPLELFQDELILSIGDGHRVASMFGQPTAQGSLRMYSVLADDVQHTLSILSTDVTRSYPSLTPRCPQVHLFEREIYEQFGIEPEGHPWLKPVRMHDFDESDDQEKVSPRYRYFKMKGEEVHEVAVGPVHAGVIEPGHFRFQCHGEIVYHLEIHLGYQHRGIEEGLVGGPHKRTIFQIETVAGDTSIGHNMAYCQAVEALTGIEATPRAQALRTVALELERLANHVGDIGALANDVGFLPTAAFCGRLRGEFLNLTAEICGSRFGRGMVRPGGVAFDVNYQSIPALLKRIGQVEKDLKEAIGIFFASQSVLNRLHGTGRVTTQECLDLGIVGLAARASGVSRDVRSDHPFGFFRSVSIPKAILQSGDVFARASVRWFEIEDSIRFVEQQLQSLPDGNTMTATTRLGANQICPSMVEGWRGELIHVAITDANGQLLRYKIVDPSFHNWSALAMSLNGQQISDFPLCNKSFNLSYCGFDL